MISLYIYWTPPTRADASLGAALQRFDGTVAGVNALVTCDGHRNTLQRRRRPWRNGASRRLRTFRAYEESIEAYAMLESRCGRKLKPSCISRCKSSLVKSCTIPFASSDARSRSRCETRVEEGRPRHHAS
eukprot:696857-Prymnesium_polylepis.1